jgi:hypothetical protein
MRGTRRNAWDFGCPLLVLAALIRALHWVKSLVGLAGHYIDVTRVAAVSMWLLPFGNVQLKVFSVDVFTKVNVFTKVEEGEFLLAWPHLWPIWQCCTVTFAELAELQAGAFMQHLTMWHRFLYHTLAVPTLCCTLF